MMGETSGTALLLRNTLPVFALEWNLPNLPQSDMVELSS